MRAVNLIPEDARRGGGSGGLGRSGGAVYALLGGLAVMVALVAAWAFAGRTVSHRRAELKTLTGQVDAMRARVAGLPAQTAQTPGIGEQLATVKALAQARMDWARTLDAVARTLPVHTSLTGLTASTSPVSAPAGGAGGAGALASSSTGPSVQVQGCAPSQKAVAQLMPRLRVVPGVQDVTLVSSTAADGASAGSGSASESCNGIDFSMILFLESAAPAPAPAPATPAAPSTPAAGAAK